MGELYNKFEKVFKCDLGGISDMLNCCMEHLVADQSISERMNPEARSRFKWVVTEMLTNAIKHSGVPECALSISTDGQRLILEKEDCGIPLNLTGCSGAGKVAWPLPKDAGPQDVEVYDNGLEKLWLTTTEDQKGTFWIQEIDTDDMPVLSETLGEHFGLLILTKASDEFAYEYDPGTGLNRFRCIFKLTSQ